MSACNPAAEEAISSCNLVSYQTKAITGAKLKLGMNGIYPEEFERSAVVRDYDIDIHEVTNAQFDAFVKATNYVTTAETPQAGFDTAGAAVFIKPTATHPNWWRFVEGANWRQPEGPESNINGQENYPVVQVSYEDALAYANWAGRDLPTEAEWEYAAKGNSEAKYVWGDERTPNGKEMANTWQGGFPIQNSQKDGYASRAPIACFPANEFGLYDMIGNVWEWTKSETRQSANTPIYVIKGGSYLCAENFCARYRSGARQFQEADFPTNHIGFRTVSRQRTN